MTVRSVEATAVEAVGERTRADNVRQLGNKEAAVWADLRRDYETRKAPVPADVARQICARHNVARPSTMLNELMHKRMIERDGARSKRKGTVPLSSGLCVFVGHGRNARQIWPEPGVGPAAAQAPAEPVVPSTPPGPVTLAPVQMAAWEIVVAYGRAGNVELRARDVIGSFREHRVISGKASASAILADLAAKGLIHKIRGTPRSRIDPTVYGMRIDAVVRSVASVAEPSASKPVESEASSPMPSRVKSRAELEEEIAAIDRQITDAERERAEWDRLATEYDARVAERERLLAEVRNERDQHLAAPPVPIDAEALAARRERLRGLVANYDLLMKSD